jgi:hypothetical protein
MCGIALGQKSAHVLRPGPPADLRSAGIRLILLTGKPFSVCRSQRVLILSFQKGKLSEQR